MLGVVAVASKMTLTDWGSWAAIIAGGIAVLIVVVGIWRFSLKKYGQCRLFVAHQVMPTISASPDQQRVQIELRMKHNTQVEFIIVGFYGKGDVPQIQTLGDYQRKEHGNMLVYALSEQKQPGNWWFWGYKNPRHRFKGSLITMAIDFIAKDTFDGFLEFQMTASDAQKVRRLPFNVSKKSGENNSETVN